MPTAEMGWGAEWDRAGTWMPTAEMEWFAERARAGPGRWRSRKLDHFCSFKLSHSLKPFFLSK
jgi:hypothetical protein